MPDTNKMFEPLIGGHANAVPAPTSGDKTPIIPVPADAPRQQFRHPKYGYPTGEYAYHTAAGDLVGYVCRFDFVSADGAPKKDFLPVTYCDLGGGARGWRSKGVPTPRPLYRLPTFNSRFAAPVLVCEGEKAADGAALLFPDYVSTTPMHGAKSPQKTDWTPLAGRAVTIWPDNDEPGRAFGQKVAALATEAGAGSVTIVEIPTDWPVKWDLADGLPDGGSAAHLTEMLLSAAPFKLSLASPSPSPSPDGGRDTVTRAALPGLRVDDADLTATARALRDIFAAAGDLFDRGAPAKVVRNVVTGNMVVQQLKVENVIHEAHRLAQPFKRRLRNGKVEDCPVTLPDRVAKLYLAMLGEWKLLPLNGITSAPVLSVDGSIHGCDGYDKTTGLWCEAIQIPPMPPMPLAVAALKRLRMIFRTFPFADSLRISKPELGVTVVDVEQPPGQDESAFLMALMTAVCRPSLWLAPGVLIVAPQLSGAGTGKGLLVRAICTIAFGRVPRAFTKGHDHQELEKRISAELIEASPVLFLDNVNNTGLTSDTLASALTERPAAIRDFGTLRMLQINPTAFVAVTGNALSVTEDLARRFISIELDAMMEDPEERPFVADFLKSIREQRMELLADLLTIWRWGRQNAPLLRRGKPFGSFETWAEWVRDPLLTLGCTDPVTRVSDAKSKDGRRVHTVEILAAWFDCYGSRPTKAADIGETVLRIIDPQGKGRQFVAAVINNLVGTHAGGFKLTSQRSFGKWAVTTYAVTQVAIDTRSPDGIGVIGGIGGAAAIAVPATIHAASAGYACRMDLSQPGRQTVPTRARPAYAATVEGDDADSVTADAANVAHNWSEEL